MTRTQFKQFVFGTFDLFDPVVCERSEFSSQTCSVSSHDKLRCRIIMENVLTVFAIFDKGKDGYINYEEWTHGMHCILVGSIHEQLKCTPKISHTFTGCSLWYSEDYRLLPGVRHPRKGSSRKRRHLLLDEAELLQSQPDDGKPEARVLRGYLSAGHGPVRAGSWWSHQLPAVSSGCLRSSGSDADHRHSSSRYRSELTNPSIEDPHSPLWTISDGVEAQWYPVSALLSV